MEIARAINHTCKLLIMDEPSTVLNPPEVENLFRIMRSMRDEGISIIYVSHKLNEVKKIVIRSQCCVTGNSSAKDRFPN